jgi:Ni,Fe-hydrogenase maturation factor
LYLMELEGGAPARRNAPVNCPAESHQMDVSDILALARSMGARLKRVLLVGCEPATLAPSVEAEDRLSPIVRVAVPEAAGMIESLVSEACTNYPSR